MKTSNNQPTPVNYFLRPGYIFLANKPTIISTVLGSCVSVCIFDRKRKTGAMNRFQYPHVGDKKKATAEFGNVSTIGLIRMLLQHGSKKNHLEAQVLGGAHNPDISPKNIGLDNIKAAMTVLKREGIPITSEDIGGEKGRKVVFNSSTNDVAVFKVEKLRESDWFPYQGER